MAELIAAEVEEFSRAGDRELADALRRSCLANLETGFGELAGERAMPARVPPAALELALLSARLGLPLAALMRAYRVGHAMAWRRWFDAVEAEAPDSEVRRMTLEIVTAYLFDYVDHVVGLLSGAYAAERERLAGEESG
jgi:hypothetical protein